MESDQIRALRNQEAGLALVLYLDLDGSVAKGFLQSHGSQIYVVGPSVAETILAAMETADSDATPLQDKSARALEMLLRAGLERQGTILDFLEELGDSRFLHPATDEDAC